MDAREVIAQIQADPALRDLLRAVLLSEELLQLPAVVALQGETLARLADRVDQLTNTTDQLGRLLSQLASQLTERLDHHDARMDQLDARMDQLVAGMDQFAAGLADQSRTLTLLMGVVNRLVDRIDEQLVILSDHSRELETITGRLGG